MKHICHLIYCSSALIIHVNIFIDFSLFLFEAGSPDPEASKPPLQLLHRSKITAKSSSKAVPEVTDISTPPSAEAAPATRERKRKVPASPSSLLEVPVSSVASSSVSEISSIKSPIVAKCPLPQSLTASRTSSVQFFPFEALDQGWKPIFQKAYNTMLNAQVPYSKYRVGVAVQGSQGIYAGCNVERATYTQTSHAEQSAVDALVASEGSGAIILKLAGVSASASDSKFKWPPGAPDLSFSPSFKSAGSPCGHCLQIIWENCRNNPRVQIAWLLANGWVSISTIDDLYPCRFGPVNH